MKVDMPLNKETKPYVYSILQFQLLKGSMENQIFSLEYV